MGKTWECGKTLIDLPKGITVRKHKKSASIQIYFTYRGVDCRETFKLEPSKKTINYANGIRSEILNKIVLGTFKYSDYFPESKQSIKFGHNLSNITIGELLDGYLLLAEKTKQPSTVRGYSEVTKAHLRPRFGSVRVRDLSPQMLRSWISSLSLTAKRVRNILTPLRAVLEQSVNDDIIERNPLDKIVLNNLLDKTSIESKREINPLNTSEVKALLKNTDGQIKNLLQFALFSGLRTSELIALQWGDIDWNKGVIKVQRAIVLKQEKKTKTKAGLREVMILPPALEALQNQKEFTKYLAFGV